MRLYSNFWKNYFNFNGIISRKDYWLTILISILFNGIIAAIIIGICNLVSANNSTFLILSYWGILGFLLLLVIPSISQCVRRLHDINKSGIWILIFLIPVIGQVILLVFLLSKSVSENNKWLLNTNNITTKNNISSANNRFVNPYKNKQQSHQLPKQQDEIIIDDEIEIDNTENIIEQENEENLGFEFDL